MNQYPFALYDAFSATIFGGSQAAVITSASSIDSGQRQRLAREFGLPATAFVDACDAESITVQFMSTVMELPMCGHGTICLLTHLLENDFIDLGDTPSRELKLRLPRTTATVVVERREDLRYRVMLDITPPEFEAPPAQIERLLARLGLERDALASDLPPETARGDFVHLVVPLTGLAAMRAIQPDFDGIVEFCRASGIETVAVFCREVKNSDSTIHVRDFCPAVGVSESAAAGTTNAALTSYLIRHGQFASSTGTVEVNAEQGLELGRPSSIRSIATLSDQGIARLQVGGVATRVMDGNVYLEV